MTLNENANHILLSLNLDGFIQAGSDTSVG
jgi:hypothetical protein